MGGRYRGIACVQSVDIAPQVPLPGCPDRHTEKGFKALPSSHEKAADEETLPSPILVDHTFRYRRQCMHDNSRVTAPTSRMRTTIDEWTQRT